MRTDLPYKICPACQQRCVINMRECGRCRFNFRSFEIYAQMNDNNRKAFALGRASLGVLTVAVIFTILSLILLFIPTRSPIVGTWQMQGFDRILILNPDGTGIDKLGPTETGWPPRAFHWRLAGNDLQIERDGEIGTRHARILLTGNHLTIDESTGFHEFDRR